MYVCMYPHWFYALEIVIINGVISFIDKPEIRPVKQSVNSWIGKTTALICEAQGEPRPVITWSRTGSKSLTVIDDTTVRSTLTIVHTSTSSFGDYTCFAGNSAGKSQININIKQFGKCAIKGTRCYLLMHFYKFVYRNQSTIRNMMRHQ